MKIDYCLILAAGFGTRMGEIGKLLPKVLWPVFEKPLLELQIRYARNLGIKRIFINLHHQATIIQDFINSIPHDDITILFEPDILDVGGAVHNLAVQGSVNYHGNLLILNSDQFLFFDKSYFDQALTSIQSHACSLFMIEVNKSGKYNQVTLKNSPNGDFFGQIIAANNVVDEIFWTYSGNSLVNLNKLSPNLGKTNFYQTVARYEKELVPVIKLEKLSYWDFGTLPRYLDSLVRIIASVRTPDEFIKFLLHEKALDLEKLDQVSQSYLSSDLKVLDFSAFRGPKIYLDDAIEFENIKVQL